MNVVYNLENLYANLIWLKIVRFRSIVSRIWMIKKLHSVQMLPPQYYHLVKNWTLNCFIL